MAAVALVAGSVPGLTGCAKEAPPGISEEGTTKTVDPAPKGETVPKTDTAEGVPVKQRGGLWDSYYRHKDGDRAVYRITGNTRKSRKLVVSYRYRGLRLPDAQLAVPLLVKEDFGDGSPLTTYVLEDETSGTTRHVGYQEAAEPEIVFYSPPPVVLDWAKAADKGYTAEIPYNPVVVDEDGDTRSAGDMTVDRFEALGRQDLKVRDATNTTVLYKDCIKWRTTKDDGTVITTWWGPIGEVVRQDTTLPDGKKERADLIRLQRKK